MIRLTGFALLLSLLLAMNLGSTSAASPPIDCRHAKKTVERAVCQSPELIAMDREIAALYDRGLAQFEADDRRRLTQAQLGFLRRRDGCAWAAHHSAHPDAAVGECIRSAMEDRLHGLRRVVDRGGYARRP